MHWRDLATHHSLLMLLKQMVPGIWGCNLTPCMEYKSKKEAKTHTLMNSLIDSNKYTSMKMNTKNLAQYMELPFNILGFPALLKQKTTLNFLSIYDYINKGSTVHQKKWILYLYIHNAITRPFLIHRQAFYAIN